MKLYWILLLFLPQYLCAQLTTSPKSVTNSTNIIHYQVLQLDSTIRHGLFVRTTLAGDTIEKGYYYNNEPVGKWLYYYEDGALMTVRNYGKTQHKLWKTTGYLVKTAEGYQPLPLRAPPHYLGGSSRYRIFIHYPKSAKRMMVEAKMLVTIIIDEKGVLSYKINRAIFSNDSDDSTKQDLIQEAKRYLNKNNLGWIPAIRNNQFVTVKFQTVIRFKLR